MFKKKTVKIDLQFRNSKGQTAEDSWKSIYAAVRHNSKMYSTYTAKLNMAFNIVEKIWDSLLTESDDYDVEFQSYISKNRSLIMSNLWNCVGGPISDNCLYGDESFENWVADTDPDADAYIYIEQQVASMLNDENHNRYMKTTLLSLAACRDSNLKDQGDVIRRQYESLKRSPRRIALENSGVMLRHVPLEHKS